MEEGGGGGKLGVGLGRVGRERTCEGERGGFGGGRAAHAAETLIGVCA